MNNHGRSGGFVLTASVSSHDGKSCRPRGPHGDAPGKLERQTYVAKLFRLPAATIREDDGSRPYPPPLTVPDSDAFLSALRPHYDDALRYCRGLCASGSSAEAEDAFQNALLRALEGFASLRDRRRFRPWLFQIITREVRRAQRRSFWRRFVPLPLAAEVPPLGLISPTPSGETLDVLDALASLGAVEREALLLYEVGGFSIDEIRQVQGDRSASAVKSRLSRARSRLRTRLSDPVPSLDPCLAP